MFFWGAVLCGINIAFMCGIFYIVLFRRGAMRQPFSHTAGDALLKELKNELSEVRKASFRLGADIERYGKGLNERQAAIEDMIRKAQAVSAKPSRDDGGEDVYTRALNMYRSGIPAGEVARRLGLLTGEADLLSALKRM
ncbi:MAG TPA: hypothetical protein DDW94_04015 [Deltaproteobacteria bacterium]|nr:MAG: hypothetical protein A2Z79_10765 [Deltaproteobacteria bacterium GWA2_55_82]OGQ62895.1 MAG: hypothetical protein A3I81_06205 [Deltaproteobacteria bacterium RIFCSPLOWO2_02_FULL_55_12]OIJ72856.1 MAG: hypothetical protein A2V21_300440 [Deltaproteobacteria bacterium GWC2_55_46]HBG46137.1 hypothetical protein [Deltaproteobacteria bacterium]HCY11635.1 hypothetical protein [Deltaproteobacteria bacterium]